MNDALTMPFFGQGSSSYPPTPPFPDSYDGNFSNPQHDFYANPYDIENDGTAAGLLVNGGGPSMSHRQRSNGMGNYPFPNPPASSHPNGTSYSNPPTFNPAAASSSAPYMPNFYTNPSAFLDVDVTGPQFPTSQAGPSTYSRPSSSGDEYLNHPEDDDQLVKMEEAKGAMQEDEGASGSLQGEEGVDGEGGGADNEEPLYVNAKQYHRILKRRAARQRLEELNRLARSRKPYLHESRHRHACSRPRGKGGRFLTADEIEALRKEEAARANGEEGSVPSASA